MHRSARSTAEHTECTGSRQNTQEHGRTQRCTAKHADHITYKNTAEHAGARQNTQQHGRTQEQGEHGRARQNKQEHGRTHNTHRSTAEQAGARENTQEHGKTHRSTAEHIGALLKRLI
eukprot:4649352-Pyramimonas_sp.AAC.1